MPVAVTWNEKAFRLRSVAAFGILTFTYRT
jgi:hypothetical protein